MSNWSRFREELSSKKIIERGKLGKR
ncbi:hypothetical protein CP082626L3_0057A, partial [Chlamydia psittaci 08-2626_L3]